MSNHLPWISRSVEPTVEKWLSSSASILLIRGQRRCGKSSTIQAVARRLGRKIVVLYVKKEDSQLLDAAKSAFFLPTLSSTCEMGGVIKEAVRSGAVVILEEIQNASDSFQVTLQCCIDTIAFESMYESNAWETSGQLVLMGSLPGIVDSIFEHRRNPLFQRIHAKLTIYQFDTLEMCRLFNYLGITNTRLMLSLHSLFQGRPHPYVIAEKAKLFQGDATDINGIVREFFASELASDYVDAFDLYDLNFGGEFAIGLKAVLQKKTLKEQICQVKDKLSIPEDQAFNLLKVLLCGRYQLIRPVFTSGNLDSIYRYEVADSYLKLADCVKLESTIRRENVQRTVSIRKEEFEQLEGFHFESWIKEIAEDRHTLCRAPCFPHLPFDGVACVFLPNIVWDGMECTEIDVVASHPSTDTLILGSCKRNAGKISQTNLETHWQKLQSTPQIQRKILGRLKLTDNYNVIFYHFVPDAGGWKEEAREAVISTSTRLRNDYVVTLQDMLEPFQSWLSEKSEEAELEKAYSTPRHKKQKIDG